MRRGDVYRVMKPSTREPRRYRFFVIVSRQVLIDSKFSTVICAPVYTSSHGLSTQVPVGEEEGLKHDSSIHCDELVSLQKSVLTQFVSSLKTSKLRILDRALMLALDIQQDPEANR